MDLKKTDVVVDGVKIAEFETTAGGGIRNIKLHRDHLPIVQHKYQAPTPLIPTDIVDEWVKTTYTNCDGFEERIPTAPGFYIVENKADTMLKLDHGRNWWVTHVGNDKWRQFHWPQIERWAQGSKLRKVV